MTNHSQCDQSDLDRDVRQLALVDRIIGLEAELANAKMAEPAQLRHDIAALRASATWRVGNAVLAPARAIRRLFRRGSPR